MADIFGNVVGAAYNKGECVYEYSVVAILN
jgi:hypothetical protein